MATWVLAEDVPMGSSVVEAWKLVQFPANLGVKNWAFRPILLGNPPPRFNSFGYWSLWQNLSGRVCYGPSHIIPRAPGESGDGLLIISEDDYSVVPTGLVSAGIAVTVHKWLDPVRLELWGYVY